MSDSVDLHVFLYMWHSSVNIVTRLPVRYFPSPPPPDKHWDPSSGYKVKVKLSLCFNWSPYLEGVLRSGGIAPRILDLGTIWRWVVTCTPRPCYPPPPQGNSRWNPLDKRLGVTQSRFGRGGQINFHLLSGLEPAIAQPVAQHYTTEITRAGS
jgi:hypothetical protein